MRRCADAFAAVCAIVGEDAEKSKKVMEALLKMDKIKTKNLQS